MQPPDNEDQFEVQNPDDPVSPRNENQLLQAVEEEEKKGGIDPEEEYRQQQQMVRDSKQADLEEMYRRQQSALEKGQFGDIIEEEPQPVERTGNPNKLDPSQIYFENEPDQAPVEWAPEEYRRPQTATIFKERRGFLFDDDGGEKLKLFEDPECKFDGGQIQVVLEKP